MWVSWPHRLVIEMALRLTNWAGTLDNGPLNEDEFQKCLAMLREQSIIYLYTLPSVEKWRCFLAEACHKSWGGTTHVPLTAELLRTFCTFWCSFGERWVTCNRDPWNKWVGKLWDSSSWNMFTLHGPWIFVSVDFLPPRFSLTHCWPRKPRPPATQRTLQEARRCCSAAKNIPSRWRSWTPWFWSRDLCHQQFQGADFLQMAVTLTSGGMEEGLVVWNSIFYPPKMVWNIGKKLFPCKSKTLKKSCPGIVGEVNPYWTNGLFGNTIMVFSEIPFPGDSKWPFYPLVEGHLTFPKGHFI